MRKIILYIAMSLDGYIADESGGVGWLAGDGSDEKNPGSYPDFIKTIDTVLMGWKTYRQIVTELSPDSWVYSGKTSYVLTHRHLPPVGDIIFTDKSIGLLASELKNQEGKDIWICGGASLVNQMIDNALIDRYCISVIPVLLGEGIPLFHEHGRKNNLKLISSHSYNGIVDLVYTNR